MTYDQFYAQWNGKASDFDGAYGNQCVDLFNFYNRDVVGAPFVPTPTTGGAADLWNDFDGGSFYTKVPYTSGMVFQKGDAVIWAANTAVTGSAGHVGMFDHADPNGFYSFDQNYPTGSLPHLQHHDYRGVLGVLRPKASGGEEMLDKDTVEFMYLGATDQYPTDEQYSYWVGRKPGELAHALYDSNTGYRYKANQYDGLATQLADSKTQLGSQQETIDDLNKKLLASVPAPVVLTPPVDPAPHVTPPVATALGSSPVESPKPSPVTSASPVIEPNSNIGASWAAGFVAWLKSILGIK